MRKAELPQPADLKCTAIGCNSKWVKSPTHILNYQFIWLFRQCAKSPLGMAQAPGIHFGRFFHALAVLLMPELNEIAT